MSQNQEETIKKYEVDTDGDAGNDAPATAPVPSEPASSPADPIPMSEHQSPWQDDGKGETGEGEGAGNDTEQEVREG